jgi:hypothetical protein
MEKLKGRAAIPADSLESTPDFSNLSFRLLAERADRGIPHACGCESNYKVNRLCDAEYSPRVGMDRSIRGFRPRLIVIPHARGVTAGRGARFYSESTSCVTA